MSATLSMLVTSGLALAAEWWPWLHRQIHKLSKPNRARLVAVVVVGVTVLLTSVSCTGRILGGFECPTDVGLETYILNSFLALISSQTAHYMGKQREVTDGG